MEKREADELSFNGVSGKIAINVRGVSNDLPGKILIHFLSFSPRNFPGEQYRLHPFTLAVRGVRVRVPACKKRREKENNNNKSRQTAVCVPWWFSDGIVDLSLSSFREGRSFWSLLSWFQRSSFHSLNGWFEIKHSGHFESKPHAPPNGRG